jgi:hypothetical protein
MLFLAFDDFFSSSRWLTLNKRWNCDDGTEETRGTQSVMSYWKKGKTAREKNVFVKLKERKCKIYECKKTLNDCELCRTDTINFLSLSFTFFLRLSTSLRRRNENIKTFKTHTRTSFITRHKKKNAPGKNYHNSDVFYWLSYNIVKKKLLRECLQVRASKKLFIFLIENNSIFIFGRELFSHFLIESCLLSQGLIKWIL